MTTPRMRHSEVHASHSIGWLRAAVLGANDGLISTGSLMVGVAAASADTGTVLLTGMAGLIAGALSMAAGEYVSVSSQADVEEADRRKEQRELAEQPELELAELTHIYQQRGLTPDLARQVAEQLTAHDALGAHLRDELGISEHMAARPVQAALASAAAFAVGALPSIGIAWAWKAAHLSWAITAVTLLLLAVTGALAAWLGGASMAKGATRVVFWGALAMAATAAIGSLFGTGPVG